MMETIGTYGWIYKIIVFAIASILRKDSLKGFATDLVYQCVQQIRMVQPPEIPESLFYDIFWLCLQLNTPEKGVFTLNRLQITVSNLRSDEVLSLNTF